MRMVVMLLMTFAAATTGCSAAPEPMAEPDETTETAAPIVIAQGSPGTWVEDSHENCADICGQGPCRCFPDQCPSQPFGKPCGPLGNTCDHIVTSTVYHMICALPAQQNLDVSINGVGFGSITGTRINCPNDCSDSYIKNTSVSITATAVPGCQFDRWTGAGCSPNFPQTIFARTITLTMSIDRRCQANFVPL